MSKSAIKYLTAANEILAALDLTIGNPASWMTNEQARGQFKNADLLACLIIAYGHNRFKASYTDSKNHVTEIDAKTAAGALKSLRLELMTIATV